MSKRVVSPWKPLRQRFPLGLVFKSFRVLHGDTLDDVGPRANLSATELSRIENGKVRITPELSARITAALMDRRQERLDLPAGADRPVRPPRRARKAVVSSAPVSEDAP